MVTELRDTLDRKFLGGAHTYSRFLIGAYINVNETIGK